MATKVGGQTAQEFMGEHLAGAAKPSEMGYADREQSEYNQSQIKPSDVGASGQSTTGDATGLSTPGQGSATPLHIGGNPKKGVNETKVFGTPNSNVQGPPSPGQVFQAGIGGAVAEAEKNQPKTKPVPREADNSALQHMVDVGSTLGGEPVEDNTETYNQGHIGGVAFPAEGTRQIVESHAPVPDIHQGGTDPDRH